MGSNLSLVEVQDGEEGGSALMRVIMVHWQSTKLMRGVQVDTDEDNKIKYTTPFTHKARSFHGCRVIHPNLGCRMAKVSKSLGRPPCPAKVFRITQMWETCRLHEGSDHFSDKLSTSLAKCHLCDREEIGHAGDKARLCTICLLPWHNACSAKVAKSPHGAAAHVHAIPKGSVFEGVLRESHCCYLCSSMFTEAG